MTDLSSPTFHADPRPTIAGLQARGALVRERLPIVGAMHFATTQAACAAVLKNSTDLTVRQGDGSVAGMKWWMPRVLDSLTRNMLSTDEPDHTRLRRAVDAAFRRRAIVDLEPRLEALAQQLLEQLAPAGEAVDFCGFCRSFPLVAICEMLGIPPERRGRLMDGAAVMTEISGAVSFMRAMPALARLRRVCLDEIKLQRAVPEDGLIGALVVLTGEDQLDDDELVSMVFLLFLAGHETTSHTLAGGLFELIRHPGQMQALRGGADISIAVEEVLRHVSAVQMTKPRFAQRDVEIEGHLLPKGSQIMALLVGANFDPAFIDEPGRFDITRAPNRHLSFGSGPHFCLGLMLARLELRVALSTITERYYTIELAVHPTDVSWRKRIGVRALKALPVRFS
ncbi:MAG: cytochrome P450 [Pseudomonadota bacterium]